MPQPNDGGALAGNNQSTADSLEAALTGDQDQGQAQNTDQQPGVQQTVNNQQPNQNADSGMSAPQEVTLPDGRRVSPEQAVEEYRKLQADYTRKSQRLSELEKTQGNNQQSSPNEQPGQQPQQTALSPQDQAIRDELKRLGFAPKDEIEKSFESKRGEIVNESAMVTTGRWQLDQALQSLESEYNGEEGKPRVERQKLWEEIQRNPQTNESPLDIARRLYYNDFVKYEAKKLISQGSALPTTEATGASNTGEGGVPPSYNFKDGSAERGLQELLNA